MPFEAQIPTPSSDHIAVALWAVATLMTLAAVAVGLVFSARKLLGTAKAEQHEITPQPLAVTEQEKLITRHECNLREERSNGRLVALERVVAEIRREMAEARIHTDSAAEDRALQLHQRIDELRSDLEKRLQDIPYQFVALLKNTGVIKS